MSVIYVALDNLMKKSMEIGKIYFIIHITEKHTMRESSLLWMLHLLDIGKHVHYLFAKPSTEILSYNYLI